MSNFDTLGYVDVLATVTVLTYFTDSFCKNKIKHYFSRVAMEIQPGPSPYETINPNHAHIFRHFISARVDLCEFKYFDIERLLLTVTTKVLD